MDFDPEKWSDYSIAGAVLHGLVLVAAGGLFVGGLFLCRRKLDRARNVVRWMEAALFFFGIFTFLSVLRLALYVFTLRGYTTLGGNTMTTVSTLAYAFQIIAKTLVLATVSSLARGILYARAGHRAKLALSVAVLTYLLTFINIALAIAYFGLDIWFWFAGHDAFSTGYYALVLHINRLSAVPMIFLLVGSVVSLAVSGLIFFKVKTRFPTLKTASLICIAASSLFFVSSLYEVVDMGIRIPLSATTDGKEAQDFGVILLFFFGTIPAFFTLALIFNLTRTKDKGLWTVNNGAQGQFQGQPMQQSMRQPIAQPVLGFQPGVAPQGAPPQGWQPQPGHYYPPQQQPT